jgi:hypothetical protein
VVAAPTTITSVTQSTPTATLTSPTVELTPSIPVATVNVATPAVTAISSGASVGATAVDTQTSAATGQASQSTLADQSLSSSNLSGSPNSNATPAVVANAATPSPNALSTQGQGTSAPASAETLITVTSNNVLISIAPTQPNLPSSQSQSTPSAVVAAPTTITSAPQSTPTATLTSPTVEVTPSVPVATVNVAAPTAAANFVSPSPNTSSTQGQGTSVPASAVAQEQATVVPTTAEASVAISTNNKEDKSNSHADGDTGFVDYVSDLREDLHGENRVTILQAQEPWWTASEPLHRDRKKQRSVADEDDNVLESQKEPVNPVATDLNKAQAQAEPFNLSGLSEGDTWSLSAIGQRLWLTAISWTHELLDAIGLVWLWAIAGIFAIRRIWRWLAQQR